MRCAAWKSTAPSVLTLRVSCARILFWMRPRSERDARTGSRRETSPSSSAARSVAGSAAPAPATAPAADGIADRARCRASPGSSRSPCRRSRRCAAGVPARSAGTRWSSRCCVEYREQLAAIFERAVHALAVERRDRMRSVADQQQPIFDRPALAAHRAHDAGGMLQELIGQGRHQRADVREVTAEELRDAAGSVSVAKLSSP